jgi:two-component system, NarL family, invasion response regulator UvrY
VIRILIADDHPLVRRGLRDLLADEPGFQIAGEAEDEASLRQLAREAEWDLCVLDLRLPGSNGLELIKTLKGWFPDRPVLVLSMHPEEQYAVRALRSGAAGYVNKAAPPRELIAALRKVSAGGTWVSGALAERLAAGLRGAGMPDHQRLSDRELEVLRLIASGKSQTEIAAQLALSVKTVSTYRSRILAKLDLRHNAELTRYALDHGLA